MVQIALFFATWRCTVATRPSTKKPASLRESIPRPKLQLIFVVIAMLVGLVSGLLWGVGMLFFLNFIAIGQKMNPRYFTEI